MNKDAKPEVAGLYYVGDGAFIPGIPAADLTPDDIADIASERNRKPETFREELLGSPLYRASKPEPSKD